MVLVGAVPANRCAYSESGRSVGEALRFFKLEPAALTVFHDELDLDPFRVKVKSGGGAAGQNGIRSIIAHAGAEFRRVRIGIGHPGHKDRVTGWVLGRANADDDVLIARGIDDALAVMPLIAEGNFNEAQKRLNTSP